ncbi:hypothetical protein C7W88_12905 [Novosphingobium sp. THN1]|uniref:hypothetical protein n=1 Tax=Novosphingobium sp. THN1 TaxID=1016987 RepID=UPI000E50CED5|nr:hypothetical protein [Novosphingobium sp. THN1]AXU19721.1 hypothetical protein C7W88_12905 [Novosphingobium sp. THN1]
MPNLHVLQAPNAVPFAPDDFAELDPILVQSNGAFRFLIDTTYGRCYPGGDPNTRSAPGAPADGAALYDTAQVADGAFRRASGQAVTYAGGGFELNAVTARGGGFIEAPASVNLDLWDDAPEGADNPGESQAWAECFYLIWPNSSTWTGFLNSGFTQVPIVHSTAGGAFSSPGERVWLGIGADGTVYGMFQQSAGDVLDTNFKRILVGSVNANLHRGLLTQVLLYRKADGTIGLRLRSSAATHTPATQTATANTSDFSANTGKLGATSCSAWAASGMNLSASKFRLFRWWIANLNRKAFDPIAKADEDYSNVQARLAATSGIYSAA